MNETKTYTKTPKTFDAMQYDGSDESAEILILLGKREREKGLGWLWWNDAMQHWRPASKEWEGIAFNDDLWKDIERSKEPLFLTNPPDPTPENIQV